jgi:hypothetical protein
VWNRHLLASVPEAFLRAVRTFNKGKLRYHWIRYLPDQRPFSGFFEQIVDNIIQTLSRSPVIESRSGILTMPCKLKYLHADYCDSNNEPLIKSQRAAMSYISEKYSLSDSDALDRLGLRSLTAAEFVADLRHFIATDPNTFLAMPKSWHTSLATALLRAMREEPQLRDDLTRMTIVPLKTGIWVATKKQQTYFASAVEDLEIPRGTLLGEIDPSAAFDQARRNLFHKLGARPYSRALVCDAIVQEQQVTDFNPDAIDVCDHVARAIFLFESGWRNLVGYDLWVATENGSAKRGTHSPRVDIQPSRS